MGTKTKEDDSTLVNTMDDLFCRFIINDDANIALFHLAIIFLGTRILKNNLSLFGRRHLQGGEAN